MSTEKLIIELDAKTAKLDQALTLIDKKLDQIEKQTEKSDTALSKLGKTGGIVGAAVKTVAVAATAAASAITAIAVASASSNKEMENLARAAKLTKEEFQSLSFATEQYGVNAENISDISKDISDKLGEFATAGTGAFQDFVDVMGLTKAEGKELASQFQDMSSDQVIGELVRRMEDAGASTNQITFALESMGNDLSKLIPLFSNNSAELDKLRGSFDAANASMKITSSQSKDLQELSQGFNLMTKTASNAATSISATLAPVLTDFFEDVISIIPQAEQAIVDFINRFIEVESLNSIEAVNEEFERNTAIMQANQWAQDQLAEKVILTGSAQDAQIRALNEYNEAQARSEELIFKRIQLEEELEKKKLADAKTQDEINKNGSGGVTTGGSGTSGAIDEELENLKNRFKSEEELLADKYEKERGIAAGHKELLLQLENEYIEALMELDITEDERNQERFDAEIANQQDLLSKKLINEEEYLKNVDKLAVKYGKQDVKNTQTVNKQKETSEQVYADAALQIGDQLFEGNKALEAGLVVAKTGAAVMHQLGSGDPYTAFARGAAAAAIGALQLSQTLSATKGGGSISSPSSSSAGSTAGVEEFTGSVEVNETVTQGGSTSSTSSNITITADDTDELSIAFVNVLNRKIKAGELVLG